MIIVKKKTYNQVRDKKKLCPNCNNKVFNATVICKNIKDGKTCFYMHQNKRTPEYIREIINSMDLVRMNHIDQKSGTLKNKILGKLDGVLL